MLKKYVRGAGLFLGCLFFTAVLFLASVRADAAAPPQVTDYKPQVKETRVKGTVTNSKGEEVTVTITHPGVGMTKTELDNMRDHVRAGDEPWTSAFYAYAGSNKCNVNPRIYYEWNDDFVWVPNVWTDSKRKEYVTIRGNKDASTAVSQAVMWYITGNDIYRRNCMNIIRCWSRIQAITPEKDFRWGITAYQLAFAAEIMRYSDCETEDCRWTEDDTDNFSRFLNCALGPSRYTAWFWMNQQSFANMGILATGVFQDNFELYAVGVEQTTVNRYGMTGGNNGSIKYQCRLMTVNEESGEAIPKERQTVQLIESGRDQGHAWATASGLSTLAQSIYVQGTLVDPETGEISNGKNAVNPFNFLDDRLLKGVTTALRYNLGYDDEWITADSSRGWYREPSEASWRGRINPCLGSLYNYYRYIENQDMTEDKYKDIARAYERYMPEAISSDDFPLAATLLYTPNEAKDNYTKGTWYAESTYRKEIENFTGDISGHPQIKTEGDINYVQMAPGAEVVCSFGWPKEGGMGLRVRADGAAKIEVRRDRKTNAPKAVFQIPDTKGEWMTVTCNTAGSPHGSGSFIYFKALGDASCIDLDYVDFDSEEAPKAVVTCNTECVRDMEEGKLVYLVPAGKNTEFKIRSSEGGAVFYADSALNNCRADSANGTLTIKPVSSECGNEQHIYLTMQKNGLASVTDIMVKPYGSIEELHDWYSKKYYPQTAEYTELSNVRYQSCEEAFLKASASEQLQAAQNYVNAFRNLQGLLAEYDFETASLGRIPDSSGNQNHARYYRNAAVTEDSGKQSKVLTLDGSMNTYAELPQGLLNGCDEFTISFDVKPDTVEGNFYTYGIGTDTTNYSYLKTLREQLVLRTTKYSNGAEQGANGAMEDCAGKWMNVKAVYEKNKVTLYVNDVFAGAGDVSLKLSDCGSDLRFYLGKSFWLWDSWFQGSFDNVKVYNYAMPGDQIDDSGEDVTVTYIIGDGASVRGETTQTVKYAGHTSPITLSPYDGYTFVGWNDGNVSLVRQDKYLTKDLTLYARFERKAAEHSAIASYDFEESTGNTVRDVTGNGRYLELFGAARLQTDTERNSTVLYLDGSSDTYAELPQGLLDNQQAVTIRMDVKPVKADSRKNYWVMGVGQNDQMYYMLKTNQDSIRSAITVGSWQNEFGMTSPANRTIKDTWVTVTVVLDQTGMRLYLDGTLLEEKTGGDLNFSDLGTQIKAYLGKSFFGADEYFAGYYDNVSIYNYAMTEEEVAETEKRKLTLTYTAETGGSITGETSQSVVSGESGSKVTAEAKEGYRFVSWSDGNKTAERMDTNVTNSISVSAKFEQIKVTASRGLTADYEMTYTPGGVLKNRASLSGRLDAKLVNMTSEDFGSDGTSEGMKFTGDAGKYVELPEGLLGEDETFSIETVFETTTKANHWLYTIGNIVDGANYLFVNPMDPNGNMLAAVKDKTSEYRVTEGTAALSKGYHTLTLTFDQGIICLYLDGEEIARKSTGYSIRDILKNGTTGGVCGFIGKSLYPHDPAFTGTVKSFKVFDCVLDSDRVKRRFAGEETEQYVEMSEEKKLEYFLSFEKENLKDGSGYNRQASFVHQEDGRVSYLAGYGNAGKAIRLNKSGSKSSIVTEQGNAFVKDSMTVSFWLRAQAGGITEEQGVLTFAPDDTESSLEISAAADDGSGKRALRITYIARGETGAKPYYTALSAEEAFPAGDWVQITVALENGRPAVYRNGESLALLRGDKNRNRPSENGCRIGTGWNDAGEQTYLTAALDDLAVYNYAWDAEAVREHTVKAVKEKIASFRFDNKTDGLAGSGAKAAVKGTVSFVEDAARGTVLSFDGSGGGYLEVTAADGSSLLTGAEELTVSYYSKPGRNGANWPFYAAPNANTQGGNPTYLGIIDNTANLTVERHNNGRKATGTAGSSGDWKHVVAVFQAETIRIYVNGIFQNRASNAESLKQILGENSIFLIGKANWGSGEYYQGLLDEYTVYNYAMTEEQVLSLEQPEIEEKETHIVSYEAGKGGKIKGSSVQQIETGADGSEVTAVPLKGYEFAGWSDGQKTERRKESRVTADQYYRAKFRKKEQIAYFSFDDETKGLSGKGAKGILSGNPSFTEDAVRGKALALNGNGQFIQAVGEDEESLLDDLEAVTITYYSKAGRSGLNWALYGTAKKANSYIGISDGSDNITAFRKLNGSGNAADTASSGEWKHVAVVLDSDTVSIYIDGVRKTSVKNTGSLSEILGSGSTLWIGTAGNGAAEYYQGLLDEFCIYNYAMTEEEIRAVGKGRIAYFSFDNETDGLQGSGAKADRQGSLTFAEGVKNQALSLDGSGTGWLKAVSLNGSSLLKDLDELTIAYYSKTDGGDANWSFYAAPDDKTQGASPVYLGISDSSAGVRAELYNQGLNESAGAVADEGGWKHVAVVYGADTIKVYINGILSQTTANTQAIRAVLGNSGILQIGKANKGAGQYYKGLLDEYSIYNYALSEEEIANLTDGSDGLSVITYAAAEGGSIQGKTVQAVLWGADTDEVTAVAAEGYKFWKWSDGSYDPARSDKNVQSSRTITAQFKKIERVTVTYDTSGNGTIEGKAVQTVYKSGSTEPVRAVPNEGNVFVQWSDGRKDPERYDYNVLESTTITAQFRPSEKFQVTYKAQEGGSIRGMSEQLVEREQDAERVTAVGNSQYRFSKWSDGIKTASRKDTNITEAKTITAEFVPRSKRCIGSFTFDDADTGLSGNGAKAELVGTAEHLADTVLVEDQERGAVLSLDGTGSCYLNVVKADGTGVLTGQDEFTVSFYSKAGRTEANWAFYAAKNSKEQKYMKENYLAVSDRTDRIEAERFWNGREGNPTAASDGMDVWKHIVVVADSESTKLYVNGELKDLAENNVPVTNILQENSILQIGKANWGSGEYYKGLLDEYSIYNYALTEEDVAKLERGEELESSYQVSYIAGRGGSITGKAVQAVKSNGSTEAVTAEAKEGYEFVRWSDGKTQAQRFDTDIHDDQIFTAEFRRLKVGKIAEFSLENADAGLNGQNAVASPVGTLTFAKDAQRGSVLSLDGGSYLKVKAADGESLLTDVEELTVSYYSKVERREENWAFYAAPNSQAQVYQQENYLAVSDRTDQIKAERFRNGREGNPTAVSDGTDVWKHVVVVMDATSTKLYIDGIFRTMAQNNAPLKSILQENSIFQIGRANWGTGEYYQGLLSDYTVYDTALTEKEIQRLEELRPYAEQVKAARAIEKGNYTKESYEALQAAIQAAEELLNKNPKTEDLEEAIARIAAAIEGLREEAAPSPDPDPETEAAKTQLTEKMTAAKAIEKGNYTDESYETLQKAIQGAEALLKGSPGKKELEEAAAKLAAAIEGLREKTPSPEPNPEVEAARTQLAEKIADVKTIEKGNYTEESYEALQAAIQAAEELLKGNPGTEELTKAMEQLTAAVEGLQEKKAPSPEPGANPDQDQNGDSDSAQGSGKPHQMSEIKTIKAVQNAKNASAVISWGAVSGAKGYVIYRSGKAGSGYKKIAAVSASKRKYTDKKVKPGKKYYYKILVQGSSASYNSRLSGKYAELYVLKRPVLKAVSMKGKKVKLSWKKVKGASGYKVYQSANNKKFKAVKTLKKASSAKLVLQVKNAKKKVYIKIRPYKLVKKKKVYGTYSKTVTVRLK